MRPVIALLKQRNFSLLWTGKFVSQLGDKMYAIAMAWWVLNASGSPGVMGLYMVAVTLPEILFGLFSGVIVDRANRRNLLVAMDLVRGILIGGLAVLFITGNVMIWHVFLVSIALSIASSFFNPAAFSIIPRIVKGKELHKANSFMQMIDGVATVAGPLLGAAAVSVISYQGAVLINAISYLASGFFETFISYNTDAEHHTRTFENPAQWFSRFRRDFKEGYTYILRTSILLKIMIYVALGHFFIGTFMVAMPLIAETVSRGNVYFLGLMEVVFGAGYILGAVFISRRKELKDPGGALKKCFTGISLASIALAVIIAVKFIPVYLVLPCLPVSGFCVVVASVYWRTVIQTNTPDKLLGRVSSVSSIVGNTALPLSFAFFGYLFSIAKIEVILFGSGCALLAATLLTNAAPAKRRTLD